MKPILFYSIPLLVYIIINNSVADLSWPYFLILLLSFVLFQMAKLRFPKDAIPFLTKVTSGVFYITTVAFIFRDPFLNPLVINILLGITIGLAISDLRQSPKQRSV
ncbi:hypothetical protein QWY14_04595 [Planococcus sp. N028]|uniref:Holin n=1 Tax=Planococcus shixiaomingii TaxID=3058393 RepID=A0ABT8N0H3_9BACL|nr:hypothetical protein [Planococcus sp. N028]MDN7241055.1 hypothetical protein [Planococcus sp. N028]